MLIRTKALLGCFISSLVFTALLFTSPAGRPANAATDIKPAADPAQNKHNDDETASADNEYAFTWPPSPWIGHIMQIAFPEPLGAPEFENLQNEIKKQKNNPKVSGLAKQKYDLLTLIATQKYDQACERLATLTAQNTEDPELIWALGAVNMMQKKPQEALGRFTALGKLVAKRRNWLVFAKQSQAWAMIDLGRVEDAYELAKNDIAALQRGEALKSHQGWFTYYIYGVAWSEKEQYDTALKSYRLARIRWIKGPLGQENTPIGRSLDLLAGDGQMAVRKYKQAQNLYLNLTLKRRAVYGRGHPLSLSAQHRLILAYFAIGELDKVVELDDEFLKMAPEVFAADSDEILEVMAVDGKVAVLMKNWERAEAVLSDLITRLEAKPDRYDVALANAYIQKGILYFSTNHKEKSQTMFNQAQRLSCQPESDPILTGPCLTGSYQVAINLAKKGEIAPAKELLKNAKNIAEQTQMATVYSNQYAAVASLLAELEKKAPQLNGFVELNN